MAAPAASALSLDSSAYSAGPPPGYGGAAPPPGYGFGPPPPEYAGYPLPDYAAYPGYGPPPDYPGFGFAPPPPGYGPPPPGYPGPPGYGDPAAVGFFPGYGPPPPGYPLPPEFGGVFGPPPPGYPPPPGAPGLGYGPAEGTGHSRSSGDRQHHERERELGGRGQRGGRKRGGGGAGGGGGDRAGGGGGGYGKAHDDKSRGKDRSQPYGVEPVQANNLYVTGLPSDIDELKLKNLFSEHGKVSQCKVFPPRPGEVKTVALIRFETPLDAKLAKDAMNMRTLDGHSAQISVRFAENKAARVADKDGEPTGGVVKVTGPGIDGIVSAFEAVGPLKATRGHEHHKGQLYVAGLPPDTSNVHLYRLFAPFGSIGPKGVHAMMTAEGRCKGIAFVNFLEEESAQLAIATYNGAVLPDGTTMKVSMKMPKNA